MSFYEFKTEDAERFAQNHGPVTRFGKEMRFRYCPYCHGGAHKDKGTFAINLETGAFNCQRSSCGAKGNMVTLSKDFDDFEISREVTSYYNINNYNGRFRTFKDAHRVTESKDGAIEYLKSRGISEAVCRKYEVTIKEKGILIFPFKDENGVLKFIKYRNTNPAEGQSKEWCEKNCMPILFGMNHCTSFDRLVVTEGQIDSLSLTEAGIENAVSVPIGKNGFSWVPYCWDWLKQFKQIVVFGDCENGTVTLAEEFQKRFPKIARTVRVEDYQGYKDANDILRNLGKQALIDAIENAEAAPIKHIKEMADIEAIDIENLPAISTGTKELNDILSGGFHFGDFVVLTGRRGEGKSTMGSQLVVEALSKGHNCMIYSGEMRDIAVKNWIDRQITGLAKPYNSLLAMCEDWYRGRLFIYDDNVIDENETDDLISTIEDAIIQKNVRFFLIDNLMTAMESAASTNEALYRQQSEFSGKLAKLARKFEVVILLVCHPRKSSGVLENDDVSGSADITNKASIVMTYSRVIMDGREIDPAVRNLSITKNRLTGKLGTIKMFYSENSKRVVELKSKDIPRMYLQTNLKDSDDMEEIPF